MGKPDPNNVPNADQTHLREPKHLKADDPGKCPRPRGCICTWFPLSLGWSRSHSDKCKATH